MKNLKKTWLIYLVMMLMIALVACKENESPRQANGTEAVALTISAASSLKEAMEEIKTAYHEEKPNVALTYNVASSGSLQKQIEEGADVDVFVSAATKQMEALMDQGLIIEDTKKNFLENKMVLIIAKDTSGVARFEDLTDDKVKQVALGEPKSVPAGQYAEEVLQKLNLLESLKPKMVYAKNVREVLAWVETGNADAGMVYATDAKASAKVSVAAKAPEGAHQPIYYPAAVLKDSRHPEASKDFVNFLYSDKAKGIFEKYGFTFKA